MPGKRPGRMSAGTCNRGTPALLVQNQRRLGRVEIDFADERFQAGVGIMQKMSVQNGDVALRNHAFVHRYILEPPRSATKQTQYPIRPPSTMTHPATAKIRQACNPECVGARDRKSTRLNSSH